MSEVATLIAGILLVCFVFQDMLYTTYSMEGGGKMTDYWMKLSWRLFLRFSGYNGRHSLLSVAGMFMMISLIFLWGMGIWLGAFLIFASDPDSVLHSQNSLSTGLGEKFYYTGYVLTTMGLGDFRPQNSTWGIVSSFFSFFGLVFITLMVSYALPVLSNIINKKRLSLFVQHQGESPAELLIYFWDGKDFSAIKNNSKELQKEILTAAKSNKAYPISHYFHSNKKEESQIITFCILDEALSILINQVPPELWDKKEVLPLRKALSSYLETMLTTFNYREKDSKEIPVPDLELLSRENIPWTSKDDLDSKRKNLWTQLLKSKGWTWNEVYSRHQFEMKQPMI